MSKPNKFPDQEQRKPGDQHKMHPEPELIRKDYKGSEKLKGKVALVTGGDSGIGASAVLHFAKEGAHIALVYLEESKDAEAIKKQVEQEGQECLLIKTDLSSEENCKACVEECVTKFGKINVLVNNHATHFPKNSLSEISKSQLKDTFETNVYPFFYLTQAALKHLKAQDSIINTSSVTAYRGSSHLVDYSSAKGAIVSFTRSLSAQLTDKKIRVNGVAPGPIWTPLVVSSFDDLSDFGTDTPMGRAGQPSELGPAYVFLACQDSSYITGQFIHINGGEIIGG
ncbi:SDR family oxidoreductase [Tamlana sp. 2_MG-2023]|uniref:SDR family oxidoreductase n=1 Tax=unclassified Tamlana TaxID=2614803 RepID=UPI0026E22A96|nr:MULTISPECIES: SDR family oxidoreductase [unclassified Tamlana]MDO6760200.1 SDR family oxidoreductase [Tamlana sp. 2_MG-2023]MDO6790102.1 SDR family oxidoreductase [Tamlana sp. 1_MG-2023]